MNMRLLISNDDGVYAPGIRALVDELSTVVDLDVMAPDRNRSGASNSLTLSKPLHVKRLQDNGFYSVEGTPTDCVHLALTGFFNPAADMVVSGINDGANLGDDILYSGTVAAAMRVRSAPGSRGGAVPPRAPGGRSASTGRRSSSRRRR